MKRVVVGIGLFLLITAAGIWLLKPEEKREKQVSVIPYEESNKGIEVEDMYHGIGYAQKREESLFAYVLFDSDGQVINGVVQQPGKEPESISEFVGTNMEDMILAEVGRMEQSLKIQAIEHAYMNRAASRTNKASEIGMGFKEEQFVIAVLKDETGNFSDVLADQFTLDEETMTAESTRMRDEATFQQIEEDSLYENHISDCEISFVTMMEENQ